jgi:hypothetical protein
MLNNADKIVVLTAKHSQFTSGGTPEESEATHYLPSYNNTAEKT